MKIDLGKFLEVREKQHSRMTLNFLAHTIIKMEFPSPEMGREQEEKLKVEITCLLQLAWSFIDFYHFIIIITYCNNRCFPNVL
jgi:hypothetical protein